MFQSLHDSGEDDMLPPSLGSDSPEFTGIPLSCFGAILEFVGDASVVSAVLSVCGALRHYLHVVRPTCVQNVCFVAWSIPRVRGTFPFVSKLRVHGRDRTFRDSDFRFFPNLVSVKLTECRRITGGAFASLDFLEKLTLEDCKGITDGSLLSQAHRCCSHLQSLVINNSSPANSRLAGRILSHLPRLEKLVLIRTGRQFRDQDFERLLNSSNGPCILKLVIRDNEELTDLCINAVAKTVRHIELIQASGFTCECLSMLFAAEFVKVSRCEKMRTEHEVFEALERARVRAMRMDDVHTNGVARCEFEAPVQI